MFLNVFPGRRAAALALVVVNAPDVVFDKNAPPQNAQWQFEGVGPLAPGATVHVDLVAPFANGLTANPIPNPLVTNPDSFVVNIGYNSFLATPPNPIIGHQYPIRVYLSNGATSTPIFEGYVTFIP